MIAHEGGDGDHKDCGTAVPDQTQTRAIERMGHFKSWLNTRVPLFRTNREMLSDMQGAVNLSNAKGSSASHKPPDVPVC